MNPHRMSSAWIAFRPAIWAMAIVASARSFAAEPDLASPRDARLEAMRQRAESLSLTAGAEPEPYRIKPVPLLRYNDATNTTTDGTLWLWEVKNRPTAALCLFMDSRDGFQWNYELVSLSAEPLHIEGRPKWIWNPQESHRGWQTDSQTPAELPNQRLTQMKALVAQYEGEENINGVINRMRLLPRPVHRYSAPQAGVVDGAIFLLVIGTNPEILIQVEALEANAPAWRIGFARISSAELTVRNRDTVVWNAKRILEWDPRHEYFSHYGPDREPGELRDE